MRLFAWGMALCLLAGTAQGAPADMVARGQYLAEAGGCNSCHTLPGGKPFAGGLAMKLPIGTLFTPNITPDKDTGIGSWSDDDFVRAMHEGIAKDGTHLYPAFPYTSYALMPREDVLAIKAYLFSVAPVHAAPPADRISFPFNQRYGMAVWNLLFHRNKQFQPDAGQSAEWNRGAYLVNGVAHCGECHTPRGVTQALDTSAAFAGAMVEGWWAYNITPDPNSGIGGWSDQDVMSYLSTGAAPGKGWAAGPMGLVVADSTRFLTPQDLKAVVTYLRTVPAIKGAAAHPRYAGGDAGETTPAAAAQAARIYDLYCGNCHGSGDVAETGLYPAMVHESTVGANPAHNLIMVILQGGRLPAGDRTAVMPGFAEKFDDNAIAALVNYLVARFGDPAATVTAADVASARKQ